MPVDSKHPQYDTYVSQWHKCRLAVKGEDAVKAAGELFLPKLSSQESTEYDAYKQRASFYNASARTVNGITGAVFRKDPDLDFPDEKFLDMVGKGGEPFITFAKQTFEEVLSIGRYGVLLDSDENVDLGVYPYLVGYCAEYIVNWDFQVVNGREVPTLVVLCEKDWEHVPDDPFIWEQVTYYRCLKLSEFVATELLPEEDRYTDEPISVLDNPVYSVELWREKKDSRNEADKYELKSRVIPTVRGMRLDYIPFVFFGPADLSIVPEKPPILDIVNINLSHYRNSADLEHGRHFTALPTPWAAGFDVKRGDTMKIGSTEAWVTEEPNAKAGYLEFSGSGLSALKEALEQKEAQMAILGARLLEEPKRAVEATDTHKMRRSGEDSITASLAITVSRGFERLLKWSAEWIGRPSGTIQCQLNTDFVSLEISPQMITGLLTLLVQGKISYSTFFYNLQKGEVIPEGRTLEDEIALIETEGPMVGNLRDALDDSEGDEDEEEEDDEQARDEEEEDEEQEEEEA